MTTVSPNEAAIKTLPTPAAGNQVYWLNGKVEGRDVPRGVGVVVTAGGVKSFILNYRFGGRQRRYTIGRWPTWTVVAAVREARLLWQGIDRGEDPLVVKEAVREAAKPKPEPEPAKTVAAMLDQFVRAHVEKRLRRPDNYTQAFDRLVKPAIGSLPIQDLRRSHIVDMLDEIEEQSGAVMADRTLSYFSSALNWYADNVDEDFTVPRLTKLKRADGQSRERVLNDEEIRAVWRAAETDGTFGAVVRFLLLTGQRRGDVYGMEWSELGEDGVWTIPGARYKTGKAHRVPLSQAALAIVKAQPNTGPLIFPGRNGHRLTIGSNRKALLDAAITKENGDTPLPHWTLHDLRRTARTLLGTVAPRDIAERILGHVVGTKVERAYDRGTYDEPKRAALEALASLIGTILDPEAAQQAKVVPLRA